ncbi:HRDC domain-containing protein, partial [Candidatus Accumulibacter vicinus]|uniref:HRDC domain-containing protein n=1 Tax=Candidatus Accumulibacter vicinus TaxID=2954382 RepID=UPI00054F896D
HALDGRAAQDELNTFLAQHRVLTIEKQWLAAGLDSHWVVCVAVANGPGALPDAARVTGGKPGRPARVDYREVLSPADFAVFASLRSLRQQLGEREGVPPYVLFTNEQLAAMARQRPGSAAALRAIDGVGEARAGKYGAPFLAAIASAVAEQTS